MTWAYERDSGVELKMRIGIVITGVSQVYSAKLLAHSLRDAGNSVTYLVEPAVLESLGPDVHRVLENFSPLPERSRIRVKLGRVWIDRYRGPSKTGRSSGGKAARALLRSLGGRKNRAFLSGVDLLCVITMCSRPDVAWSYSGPTVVFVESWDHPYKPQHLLDGVAVAWNRFTAGTWERRSGSPASSAGFPLKLTYALGAAQPKQSRPENLDAVWMYAMTLSSLYRDPSAFDEELRLIELLNARIAELGAKLVVKAKPNQDYAALSAWAGLKDIRLLPEERESVVGDYYLSDAYNAARARQMNEVDGVIALGTTFLFDAAVADRPVLYLDAAASKDFTSLKAMTHRSKHICECLASTGIQGMAIDELMSDSATQLEELTAIATSDKHKLRAWLTDGDESQLAAGREHLGIAAVILRAANASGQRRQQGFEPEELVG